MKIYVTLYALTKGILQYEAKISNMFPDMASVSALQNFHNPNWYLTFDEAKQRAETMRTLKISALKHQVRKLEKTTFTTFKEAT